jgi:YidC/Oxa1 family membrane protein insertase
MDTRRLVLFVIFSMSILMLWESWQAKNAPPEPAQAQTQISQDPSVPNVPAAVSANTVTNDVVDNSGVKLSSSDRFTVKTDVYEAEIDSVGGDLRKVTLLKHRADESDTENFVLLDDAANPMVYVAQTGLLGAELPTHKSVFTAKSNNFTLDNGSDSVEVRLNWSNDQYSVDKVYVFHRNNYVIDVNYEITNNTGETITPAVYYQVIHDDESNQGSALMPTFTGGTYYTDEKKFNKIQFSEMEDEALNLTANDGWVGLLQHYFVSAWIPKEGMARTYYTKQLDTHLYSVGAKSNLGSVAANTTLTVPAKLFTGPQTKRDLQAAAPGLDLTVDYGILKIVATPLFWLLDKIHGLVNNWGVAIILLTILIKAAFYPLSAKSYKSMAQMRELAPRLASMKEKFGDDRQKMQMAMMELYKKEKINPMSGCLPILIQIPVFISLYWMLLGSVELRHAPFFGWIQDLSATDPYYILPLLMGASMIIQTSLNPPPTDPIQAKVMKIMPVVFSIFFFFFPAGLVLYWLVNNIISIWQQWYINKSIHAAALAKKGNAVK